MPELPEVQTIVNQLAEHLIGKKITKVIIRLPKIFQGDPKDVEGVKISSVTRRAKMIVIKLDNNLNLVIHLKMTGQLVYGHSTSRHSGKRGTSTPRISKNDENTLRDAGQASMTSNNYMAETISFHQGIPFAGFSLPGKTTHVIFDLDLDSKLFFNDNRQFGWVKVMNKEELAIVDGKHGPEPFEKDFTPDYLLKICQNWGRPIKILLMEQSKIAGIGNIYANEALWCAAISPMKRARDLAEEGLSKQSNLPAGEAGSKNEIPEKIQKLYDCIKETLATGLKYGGSSAMDEAFVNALGEKGKMQEHFVVYQKQGTMCPRCGGEIKMSRIGGRGTFFCPKCQK